MILLIDVSTPLNVFETDTMNLWSRRAESRWQA